MNTERPSRSFSFVGAQRGMAILSALLITIAVGAMIRNLQGTLGHPLNLGIEFTGGVELQLDLGPSPDVNTIRGAIAPLLDRDPTVQVLEDGGRRVVRLRTEQLEDSSVLLEALSSSFPDFDPADDLLLEEEIGGQFSSELAKRALVATFVGILIILGYIGFRFTFSFALGAVVALVHDLVVLLGVFALFGIEVGLPFVAAILTILGYSINDTIVVFDRIRETRRKKTDLPIEEVVEESLWATLSRTINTTTTTLLAISAIHIFGGITLRPFTTALLVGFVSGTYSSLFVASPFVIWYERRAQRVRTPSSPKSDKEPEISSSPKTPAPKREARPSRRSRRRNRRR
ncbi:protein translocase subunit SecF [bacterium]|nr:protein translocase subunit SecF [bacterium]